MHLPSHGLSSPLLGPSGLRSIRLVVGMGPRGHTAHPAAHCGLHGAWEL